MDSQGHDVQGDNLSWVSVIQRIAVGVAGAAVFGAGSVMVRTANTVEVHEERLTRLEASMAKIPEIDKGVAVLNGKLDVVNQKLDDAKDALRGVSRDRIR